MLILRVGDPHVKVSNLEESNKLLAFVYKKAMELKVNRIELLGDLYHTHAIVRLEVMAFWEYWLEQLASICEVVVLVGNHDQTGDYSSNTSALSIFKKIKNENLQIIDSPKTDGIFGYIPYIHDQEDFVSAAEYLYNEGHARVLVCHQTFNGAKYESGMYAPDGFDPERLSFKTIISGHIHSRQRFSKVIYPGTAKWDTNSDANEEKGLWLVKHDLDGSILTEEFIDTSGVCTPIIEISYKEGEEMPTIPAGKVTVELVGTSAWIKKQKESLKSTVAIKCKITDSNKRRETFISKDLLDFVGKFETIAGVNKEKLIAKMKELNLV